MSTSTLVDRVKVASSTVGTGSTIGLGAAVPSYRGVEALADGATYSYLIEQSADFEYGRTVWSASGSTMTRGVIASSNANSPIALVAGATIAFVLLVEDLNERIGVPANLTVGTVTASAPGGNPAVSIRPNPTTPNFVVDYVLPRGQTGDITPELEGLLGQVQADAAQTASDVVAANLAAQQATAALLGLPIYAIAYASTLPQGVTALSAAGVGTGSGGTPGTYAGGVSGGPTGFAWTYTIGSDGKVASYVITNKGRSTTTALPTLTYPTGGLVSPTLPVPTVSTQIDVNGMYLTPTTDGLYLNYWQNTGSGAPVAVVDPQGRQIQLATGTALAGVLATILPLAPETGWNYAIGGWDVDGFAFRAFMLVDLTGATTLVGPLALPAASVGVANLDAATRSLLMGSVAPETGFSFVKGGWDVDGFAFRATDFVYLDTGQEATTADAGSAGTISRPILGAPTASYGIIQAQTGAGSYRIDTISRTTPAIRRTVAASGRNPILTLENIVLFDDPSQVAPSPTQRWVPAAGGLVHAALPGYRIRFLGDSQIYGAGADAAHSLSKLLAPYISGWLIVSTTSVYAGVPTQRSDQIKARYVPGTTLVTLPGNTLPTSGSVEPTALVVTGVQSDNAGRPLRTSSGSGPQTAGPLAYLINSSMTGTLAGVPALMAVDGNGVYGFSQIGGTGSVAVPAGTPFIIDQLGQDEYILFVEAGRNNYLEPIQVRADHTAMRAAGNNYIKYILCHGITNTANGTEDTGSSGLTGILALNALLCSDYGGDGIGFIDVYKLARGDAPYNGTGGAIVVNSDGTRTMPSFWARTGLSPTPTDTAWMVLGRLPQSALAGDLLHWNQSLNAAIVATENDILQLNGWKLQ